MTGLGELKKEVVQLDVVWVIAYPGNKGMIYHPPGLSAAEAWHNCGIFLDSMQKQWNRDEMHKKGFRARRVSVQFEVISYE